MVLAGVGAIQFDLQDYKSAHQAYDTLLGDRKLGTATRVVTRNSEQYRALIGDEPGLRAIADQLEGEIIVVWKDKAYHIK